MKYNFAKLLQSGGTVQKYQTPAGRNGVTYRSPISDTWNNTNNYRALVNQSYEDVYKNKFAQDDFNMDAYNNFLGQYYDLMKNSKYQKGNGAVYYDGTNAYQKEFDRQGFHTHAFQDGWQHVDSAYTGDRFDTNYNWKGGDDYVGQTTANRYANSFNQDELARQNAIAAQHGMQWILDDRAGDLNTEDGRQFYKLEKAPQASTTEAPADIQPNTETPEQLSDTPQQPGTYEAIGPEVSSQYKDTTPWTDWIPLSMQHLNNIVSADRQARWQKKMRFPLIEGPFLQHAITNGYYQRAAMQQQANDLRNLGQIRSNSSDIRENLDNARKYDIEASNIEKQAEQVKANIDAKERQIAEQVVNQDKQIGAEVANTNMKSNVAAWNNILDANMKRDLRRTESLNSYIGNMYTSHGEWLKDQRLNEQAYQKGLNAQEASLKQQEAYQKYYDTVNDFTKSQAYQDFINKVKQSGEYNYFTSAEDYNNPAKLKELWLGDSDLAAEYRQKWEDEKRNAMNNYLLENQIIANELNNKNLLLPAIINNQGFRFLDKKQNTSNIHPVFRHANGGRLGARFIDYMNHIQKEQQYQKTSQHKRNELSQRRLNADLERLSKEQHILLRSIFK